jgi:hypothetical protein
MSSKPCLIPGWQSDEIIIKSQQITIQSHFVCIGITGIRNHHLSFLDMFGSNRHEITLSYRKSGSGLRESGSMGPP